MSLHPIDAHNSMRLANGELMSKYVLAGYV